jgi:hypothetical protein
MVNGELLNGEWGMFSKKAMSLLNGNFDKILLCDYERYIICRHACMKENQKMCSNAGGGGWAVSDDR